MTACPAKEKTKRQNVYVCVCVSEWASSDGEEVEAECVLECEIECVVQIVIRCTAQQHINTAMFSISYTIKHTLVSAVTHPTSE
jgi:hypothetical protein